MNDDAQVPPHPARWARGWRAGLRTRSRWLAGGLMAWAVAAAWFGAAELGVRAAMHAWLRQAMRAPDLTAMPVWPGMGMGMGGWAAVLGGGALAIVVTTLATGAWGSVRRRELARLRARPVRPTPVLAALAVVLVIALAVQAVDGVLAGSVRAVDATEHALTELWHIWLVRVLIWSGVLATGFGLAEAWMGYRAIGRALHQTAGEARREAKEDERG